MYGELLMQKLASSGASVYLVNTGWHSGSYVSGGQRFDLGITRQIIDHIHSGVVLAAEKTKTAIFDLNVPTHLPGVDDKLLNPQHAWSDPNAYQENAKKLYASCHRNFEQYEVETVPETA